MNKNLRIALWIFFCILFALVSYALTVMALAVDVFIGQAVFVMMIAIGTTIFVLGIRKLRSLQ